jgi:hypothetical protein
MTTEESTNETRSRAKAHIEACGMFHLDVLFHVMIRSRRPEQDVNGAVGTASVAYCWRRSPETLYGRYPSSWIMSSTIELLQCVG